MKNGEADHWFASPFGLRRGAYGSLTVIVTLWTTRSSPPSLPPTRWKIRSATYSPASGSSLASETVK